MSNRGNRGKDDHDPPDRDSGGHDLVDDDDGGGVGGAGKHVSFHYHSNSWSALEPVGILQKR